MRFRLYLELGTRAEDEKILELLRFPMESTFGFGLAWSAVWWAHGETKRTRSKDREQILSRISLSGLNELDLKGKSNANQLKGAHPHFTDVWSHLTLSPMNILWAPVPEHELANRPEERRRRNLAAHEGIRAGQYSKPYPSIVEYMLGIETGTNVIDGIDVQGMCVDLIRAGISEGLADCDVFGYGCLDASCRSMRMTHNVAGRGGNIDMLGEKFENIYPLLIGPKASCEALAVALGSLQPVSLASLNESSSYIMRVPPEKAIGHGPRSSDVLAPVAANPTVRRWLV